jgi:hypothetical protein
MKKSEKLYLIIILIGLPLLVYTFFFSQNQNKLHARLDKEGIVDTAVVVREFIGAKRKLYFEYVFYVDDNKFNGFLQYSPSQGQIVVGDSFLVRFLPDKPDEINKLLEDINYKLIRIE